MTAAQNNPMTENLLTVAEIADRMRVSRMTVYRLVHSGALHSVRFGRSYRVPATAAQRYLDSRDAGTSGQVTMNRPFAGPTSTLKTNTTHGAR